MIQETVTISSPPAPLRAPVAPPVADAPPLPSNDTDMSSDEQSMLAAALRADFDPFALADSSDVFARSPSYYQLEDCIFEADSSSSADLWKSLEP